jgi:hypothetical protein
MAETVEHPARWDKHRGKRRPDLEVCLECGKEMAVEDMPDTWEAVSGEPPGGGLPLMVGFVCGEHGAVARDLGLATGL